MQKNEVYGQKQVETIPSRPNPLGNRHEWMARVPAYKEVCSENWTSYVRQNSSWYMSTIDNCPNTIRSSRNSAAL